MKLFIKKRVSYSSAPKLIKCDKCNMAMPEDYLKRHINKYCKRK